MIIISNCNGSINSKNTHTHTHNPVFHRIFLFFLFPLTYIGNNKCSLQTVCPDFRISNKQFAKTIKLHSAIFVSVLSMHLVYWAFFLSKFTNKFDCKCAVTNNWSQIKKENIINVWACFHVNVINFRWVKILATIICYTSCSKKNSKYTYINLIAFSFSESDPVRPNKALINIIIVETEVIKTVPTN